MWTTISVLLLAAAPPLDVRPALHDTSSRAPDTRPPLIAVGRVKREDSKLSAERSIKIAVQRAKNAKRAVVDAARAAERAKESLSKARKKARERHEELDILRERHHRHYDEPEEKQAWRREVRMSRTATLIMLFCFTFLNGVARRSLSSSGPSMVSEGLLTERRADEIFMVGFEAFAVGKFLVVPQTILLGVRHSLLLQLLVMAGCCFSYLVRPTSSAVHLGAWVVFRIFSAMAVSTMLPFVGAWFPRQWYGRVFAVLFTGFQSGYLYVSYYWQHLLFANRLHWSVPFAQCALGFTALFVACAIWLKERPPPPPEEKQGFVGDLLSIVLHKEEPKKEEVDQVKEFTKLMHKVGTRWVFWAMVLACAAYTPAVEYSTHVTSYLKEMVVSTVPKGVKGGFVCLQSTICEGRYRNYVFSYVSALLLGSIVYDRASQLDRAFLVVGLLLINACCWILLALAEPDAPAPAWVKTAINSTPVGSMLLRGMIRSVTDGPNPAIQAATQPLPYLPLSGTVKTTLASIAGATIALPSSLPFAIFSLDFGKEGAAVLSGLLSVIGSVCALTFLKKFPSILRSRGWFGVHASLAVFGCIAALAMGAIMFSDSRKFARGYVIRSSLLNETVITLHACARPMCAQVPMWRPGQRRAWGPDSGTHFKPYAPSSCCHNCGKGDRLVECSVDEAAVAAALQTPYERCGEWIRAEKPLRKPKAGWAFNNDPEQYELGSAMDQI